MKVYVDVFRTQKAGNSELEYEDAFWPPHPHKILDKNVVRIAVADGATDAIFSGLWARLLVKTYGRHRLDVAEFSERVARLGRAWNRIVTRRPLPWYAEERARAGAFAALIGVELTEGNDPASGEWSAMACGDSCFFQLRNNEVVHAFPLTRSEEFSSTPFLLSSAGGSSSGLDGISVATGSWSEGDCFYLMTDALACWFLTSCEQGSMPWQLLRNITLAKDPPFEAWISELRESRQIKNDDCTLVSVTLEHR